MLTRGASLAGTTNGAKGASAGRYRDAGGNLGCRANCRRTRAQVAARPRVRRLAKPRRIKPRVRSSMKRTSAHVIDIPLQLQLSEGGAGRAYPRRLR